MAGKMTAWAAGVVLCAIAGATPTFGCGVGQLTVREPLIDRTTAGQNRCTVTKGHERPFVIEWDPTDLSSFEAKARSDVLFVRYAGCELTVLDQCSDGSVPGRYGTYQAPQETTGGIEVIAIHDEDTLYAQLPLGAAALSSRLESGADLRLRYYVSGVRTASRDSVYASDLVGNQGCEGATHFVWGYNLGAFEIDSVSRSASNAGVAFGGAGAGGGHGSSTGVVKRGGLLDACTKQEGFERAACRVPIRLVLRPISQAARPPSPAIATAVTPDAGTSAPPSTTLNSAAGTIEAMTLWTSAMKKQRARDGAGCVADLVRAEQLSPSSAGTFVQTRAACEMLAGNCDLGRRRLNAALADASDATRVAAVEREATYNCPLDALTAVQKRQRLTSEISSAAIEHDWKVCVERAHKLAAFEATDPAFMAATRCAEQLGQCDEATDFARRGWPEVHAHTLASGAQMVLPRHAAPDGPCAGRY